MLRAVYNIAVHFIRFRPSGLDGWKMHYITSSEKDKKKILEIGKMAAVKGKISIFHGETGRFFTNKNYSVDVSY